VEFSILGPLQVRSDGREVALGATKPRILLLRLLIDANRAVAAERLIEDLWEGEPPRTAEQTLQGYVSQLRKALGADRLLTRGGGYELVLESGTLDAEDFETSVAEARHRIAAGEPDNALKHLRHAFGLLRGAPLTDAGGAEWAMATIARLEETRLTAVEAVLEAQLTLGGYTDVITAAEAAIAEHPLRERLWAQLMTALYHEGRQAEALRAYQRLRRLLGEELGIDPSRELVELEASMVRQDPALAQSEGAPRADARSSGTLTFLFTDLETSTRLWEEHGAAMPAALARHDAILRAAVEHHDGRVVKTTGDGTFAVFTDAASAVRAAIEAQRMLAEEPWGATGPLRARIALHTGIAESRDGDYFGPTLNRAARLMAIGHGGQVLVSQSTEGVLRDTDGIEVLDLGEHRLRDLTRPERVFQVLVPGQPAEFPSLRSLDVLPTNLPVQLTSFVGRVDELQRVQDLLAEHRIVTITGVGGVGKTRVALQVAAEIIGEFADGAWCCEIAAATDEESMHAIMMSTLHVPARTGMTPAESIVEFLRHKELLLVLDNCEHLLEPAARLVDHVLRSGPRVRVLGTSREALDVDGERAVPLRSMSVSSSDSLDATGNSDAVKLFVDRATTARADFALEASNAATINTICRRLDGIPLAIELAAVRVVSMSPSEIAGLLDERFRLLTGGRRVALERHQTLRAAVEWSYGLLDPLERAVFDRLAVFAGSFDALAARAVVTDDTVAEWDVIDALDGLVRKSLLLAEGHAGGGTRYQMLETLRQYALDRLDERGEADHWRRRHAEHFASLFTEIAAGLRGPDEFLWRARREPEIDNLRAAISWTIDFEETTLLTDIMSDVGEEALSMWKTMGAPATRALALLDRVEPAAQVMLLMLASLEAYILGDVQRSSELNNRAEGLAGPIDLVQIFLLLRQSFGPDFAESALRRRAVEMLANLPDQLESSGLSAVNRSRCYASLVAFLTQAPDGDLELAAQLVERCYKLALESQNPSTLAFALFAIGELKARDDPDEALVALDRCIELNAEGAALATAGGSLYLSALILAHRGQHSAALSRLHRAIEFLAPRGRNAELDGAFGYSIEVLVQLGEQNAAAVLIGAVLGGVLQNLRHVALPRDRSAPDVRALRDAMGVQRFNECVAQGSRLSYDELVTWILGTLEELIGTAPADS
jgi:predicted ATPase/DNA-binding SARP family transcriptional activator